MEQIHQEIIIDKSTVQGTFLSTSHEMIVYSERQEVVVYLNMIHVFKFKERCTQKVYFILGSIGYFLKVQKLFQFHGNSTYTFFKTSRNSK